MGILKPDKYDPLLKWIFRLGRMNLTVLFYNDKFLEIKWFFNEIDKDFKSSRFISHIDEDNVHSQVKINEQNENIRSWIKLFPSLIPLIVTTAVGILAHLTQSPFGYGPKV